MHASRWKCSLTEKPDSFTMQAYQCHEAPIFDLLHNQKVFKSTSPFRDKKNSHFKQYLSTGWHKKYNTCTATLLLTFWKMINYGYAWWLSLHLHHLLSLKLLLICAAPPCKFDFFFETAIKFKTTMVGVNMRSKNKTRMTASIRHESKDRGWDTT